MADDTEAVDRRAIEMIGVASAVMNVAAFTAFGYFVFVDVAYSVILGVFSGIGAYVFLPWFFMRQMSEKQQQKLNGGAYQKLGGVHRGALGFGLGVGTLALIVARFVVDDTVVGIGTGVASTLIVYLIVAVLVSLW